MASSRRSDFDAKINLSVFDRLIDTDPDAKQEPPQSRMQTLRELKRSVKRDLEWLLNSRRMVVDIDPNLEETHRSIITYGLSDITCTPLSGSKDQRALAEQVETVIKLFAPNLMDVQITCMPPNEMERSVSLRIEAKIDMEPAPEPIVFDTVLQMGNGEFGVKEG